MYNKAQIIGLLLMLLGACGMAFAAHMSNNRIVEFTERCDEKGGIVLTGYKTGLGKWAGCYEGLYEIENEEK